MSPSELLLYMAHPLGADVDRNEERAIRWLRWLMDREIDTTVIAPWLPYVRVFRLLGEQGATDTGHPFRERCMRDNLAAAERCDGVVLVGGRISNGMRQEAEAVLAMGGFVIDLTHMGDEPPADGVTGYAPSMYAPRLHGGDPMPWDAA